jgi:hypothetical protein
VLPLTYQFSRRGAFVGTRPAPAAPGYGKGMTVPDGGGSAAGDDVLEMGSRRGPVLRWRPPTVALVLGAAGLLVGLVAGYAVGARHAGKPPVPAPASASPTAPSFAAGGYPLSQSLSGCSAQTGHELQLGLEITNLSTTAVTLRQVTAVLPLGGLKTTSQAWGPCGELPGGGEAPGNLFPPTLGPGASAWFTVTFQVLVRCPQPLPVQFRLEYDQDGRPAAMPLPGFPDLGQVPYSGCP